MRYYVFTNPEQHMPSNILRIAAATTKAAIASWDAFESTMDIGDFCDDLAARGWGETDVQFTSTARGEQTSASVYVNSVRDSALSAEMTAHLQTIAPELFAVSR